MAKRLNYQIGFTGDTSQLQTAINEAVVSLDKLFTKRGNLSDEFRKAAAAAQDLSLQLKNAMDPITNQLDLAVLNRNLDKSGKGLNDYAMQLNMVGRDGQEAFLKVAQAISMAELPIRRSNAALDQLWITMKNTARWQLTSSALHGFIGAVQTAYGYTKDLNESLNSIRIVTQKSVEDMDKFAEKANQAAQRLSTTTTNYTDASLIYYQQGLTDEEVLGRTEVTVKLANAAGEAAEKASEQLTAVWNNFYDGSKSLEYYADVMTALGASTASSTEEISQGLQKFAAVADTVGLSYEYAAAALATITATTRESASTVGTALRTIFGRLEGLKLGEALDDGTDLNKYSLALAQVGVDIKDTSGNLKDMDQILDETMAKWQTLTRDQQMGLAQTVAGVRQYAQFIALMDQSDFFKQNVATARGSEGALQEQANIYAESWEAARDRVKAAAQDVYDSIIDDDFFIGVDNGITGILNRVSDVIDAMGGAKGTLLVLANLMMTAYGDKMASGMRGIVANLQQQLGLNDAIAISMKEQNLELLKDATALEAEKNELTEIADVQNTLTQKYAELQLELVKNANKLNEADIQGVKNILEQAKATKEVVDGLAEAAQKAKEMREEYQTTLDTLSRGRFNRSGFEDFISVDSKFGLARRKELREVFNINQHSRVDTITNAVDSVEGYEKLIKVLENTNRRIIELGNNSVDLAKKMHEGSEQEQADAKRQYELNEKELAQQKEKALIYEGALKNGYTSTKDAVEGLRRSTNELINAQRDSVNIGMAAEERMEQEKNTIQELTLKTHDWASTIVSLGRALSSIAISINAIQSLYRVWTDDDLSTVEKFTQTMMSLSMLLPTITSGLQLLGVVQKNGNTAQAIYNVLLGKGNAEDVKGIFGKSMLAKAQKLYNIQVRDSAAATAEETVAKTAGAAASGTVTAAKTAEAVATETVTTVTQAYLLTAGQYLLIAAAIGAAIYGLIALYNKDADAAKRAAKAHEEANKAANEAQNAYKELTSTIKDYDEAVKALDDLTEGTDEYRQAVEQANDKTRELLENYKELKNTARYDSRGLLVVDTDTARLLGQQRLTSAQINANMSGIAAAQAQQIAANTALRRQAPFLSLSNIERYRVPKERQFQATERFRYKESDNEQLQRALDSLIQDGINPLTDLTHYSDNVASVLKDLGPEISDWIKSQQQINQELNLYKEGIARSTLSAIDGYDKLTTTQQTFFAKVFRNQLTDENLARARARIESRYTELGDSFQGSILNRDRLIQDYVTITGEELKDAQKKTNEQLLEYISNYIAPQAARDPQAIEEALSKINNDEATNVIQSWIANDAKNLDFSQISPILAQQFKRAGLKETLNIFGEDYGDAFYDQLSKYDITPWVIKQKQGLEELADAIFKMDEAVTSALGKLSNGEFLEEEDITALQEIFGDGEDFTGFENLSVDDQIAKLEFLADRTKENKEELDKYYKSLKATYDELVKAGGEPKILEALEKELDTVQKRIEQLKRDIEKEPWKIKIETTGEVLDTRVVAAKIANLREAFALFNDDLTISRENIAELGRRYPDALAKIWYDADSNILRINEDMYEQLKNQAYAGLEEERDLSAQRLLDNAQTEAGIIEVINIAEGLKKDARGDTLQDAIQKDSNLVTSATEASKRIVVKLLQDEISKRQAWMDSYVEQGAESEATAQTVANHLSKMEDNSKTAAQNFQGYFLEALNNVSGAFAKWIANPEQALRAEVRQDLARIYAGSYDIGETIDADSLKAERKQSASYKAAQNAIDELQGLIELINKLDSADEEQYGSFYERIRNKTSELMERGILTSEQGNMLGAYTFQDGRLVRSGQFLDQNANSSSTQSVKAAAQQAANEFLSVLEDILEPIQKDKNSSGSSGSGASQVTRAQDLKEFSDRYHEITLDIEEQSDLLNKINTEIDRAYGTKRLAKFDEQLKEINKQSENYLKKAEEARGYLGGDLDKARAAANLFGFALDLDSQGDISNYTSVLRSAWNQVDQANKELQAAQDAYNLLEGQDKDSQAVLQAQAAIDAANEILDKQKDNFDKLKDALDLYEDTLKIERENIEAYKQSRRDARDAELNKINYVLEVKLDIKSLKDDLREFEKTIAESYGDALTHTITKGTWWTDVSTLNKARAEEEIAMYDDYLEKYKALRNYMASDDGYTNIDETRQSMEELVREIISSGESLLDWVDYWENMVPEAVDAARERFDQFTNQLAHNVTVLDTVKELYALQGQTYKTQQGFDRLQRVSQERMEAQVANAQLQRQWFENAERNLANAQRELDNYLANGGQETGIEYDYLKNARDAFLEEFNSAQEAYLASAKEAMETARDMYLQEVERTTYELGQTLSQGIGLDLLQDKYDHYIENEEMYLDKVNESYETASWYNKLQADIDKTSNSKQRDRLKSLQEEIDLRRESNTLSKYDLDVLEAKYKVLQAQMELEDAQNNKTELRLVRDQQGNWNYQYTANPDDVINAEQNLLDAENEWYNITKERVKEVTGEIISTYQEMQNEINQIYQDAINRVITDEEANARVEELKSYYTTKINILETEKQVAIADMDEAAIESQIHSAEASKAVYATADQSIKDLLDVFKEGGVTRNQILSSNLEGIQGLIDNHNQEFIRNQGELDKNLQTLIQGDINIYQLLANKYGEDLGNMTVGTDKFQQALDTALSKSKNAYDGFRDKVQDVAEDTNTTLHNLDQTTRDLSDSTDELRDRGYDAAEALGEQMDAAYDAAEGYRDFAQAVEEAIRQLRDLAAAQTADVEDGQKKTTYDHSAAALAAYERGDMQLYYEELLKHDQSRSSNSTLMSGSQIDAAIRAAASGNEGAAARIEGIRAGQNYWNNDAAGSLAVFEKEGVDFVNGLTDINEALERLQNNISGFATGGYTGDWSQSGKLAFLHQKELVLNQEDTENILAAVGIMRDITSQLDANAQGAIGAMAMRLGGIMAPAASSQQLDQTIHIDEVSFPNITSADGIEAAFRSLADNASQWIQRRRE